MKPRLLVVDDNALLRELIYVALKDRYEVTALRDAKGLAAALASQEPDFILLDAGIEDEGVLRRAAVPIVLMTAMRGAKKAARSLQARASGVLVKPFTTQELLDALSRAAEAF